MQWSGYSFLPDNLTGAVILFIRAGSKETINLTMQVVHPHGKEDTKVRTTREFPNFIKVREMICFRSVAFYQGSSTFTSVCMAWEQSTLLIDIFRSRENARTFLNPLVAPSLVVFINPKNDILEVPSRLQWSSARMEREHHRSSSSESNECP